MRFVETPVFTREIQRLLTDEEYRALQVGLMLRPEQGPVIPRGGGIRKIRWAAKGKGKRGGIRVIYYWEPRAEVLYMLFAYSKLEVTDLTPEQTRQLGRLVREEFK